MRLDQPSVRLAMQIFIRFKELSASQSAITAQRAQRPIQIGRLHSNGSKSNENPTPMKGPFGPSQFQSFKTLLTDLQRRKTLH